MIPSVDATGATSQPSGSSSSGRAPSLAARPSVPLARSRAVPVAVPGRAAPRGRPAAAAGGSTTAPLHPTQHQARAPSGLSGTPGGSALSPAPGDCLSSSYEDYGYKQGIEAAYEWGPELGKGGNGVVRAVVARASGARYAAKAIRKAPPPDASDAKRCGHAASIRREVEVLRRLAGSLEVVKLVDVYEDNDHVYIIQELCGGGELHARINARHYSERTVASYMRAVLRTLAQCHSRNILHRDVKPGNFMLLDDSERSPLKAIDFGLAVPFDPEGLPRTDLGLEGTPWYMAPEVLSSQVLPASDVWSAGVMAHQLLTGRLPFDDHRNPVAPSISAVWRSVLCDKVAYNMPWWAGVSDEAKAFVDSLLQRNPAKRPTAKEALKHPWLRGDSGERSEGRQIARSVVARLQRFAQSGRFKRSVLQLIAEELLSRPGARAALAASASLDSLSSHDACDAPSPGGSGRGGGQPVGGGGAACPAGALLAGAEGRALRDLYRRLAFDPASPAVERAAAAEALTQMGFRLRPCEAARLAELLDTSGSGKVRASALAAAQLDWRRLQTGDVDAWMGIARAAFSSLDKDGDGVISPGEILGSLRAKLPRDELALALAQAREEAGLGGAASPAAAAAGVGGGGGGLDFAGFLAMLKVGSMDSLDQYDPRLDAPSPGSLDRLQSLLDASSHGSDGGSRRGRGAGQLSAGAPAGASAGAAAASPDGKRSAGANNAAAGKPAWALPPPNFRFDFGDTTRAASDAGGVRPWPGAAAAPGPAPAPPARPAAAAGAPAAGNGAVRGGGQFDKRMHGASLYRNMLVAHAPGALATVHE